MPLSTDDFDFHLPPELIARHPLPDRQASRMLVVDRTAGTINHQKFTDLPAFLRDGDRLVLNNTRVVPARFFSNDGRIELLRLGGPDPLHWLCLVKPGKRMKPGRTIGIGDATGTVMAIDADGNRLIEWDREVDPDTHGQLALPPYLDRQQEDADRERYQTVYAREEGAIASPTAGLHFTPGLLETLPHSFLTLHVGLGTFRPVSVDNVADHRMHEERFHLDAETAAHINAAQRVVAVGTTVTRVLEHLGRELDTGHPTVKPALTAASGATDIFIYPPYRFRIVDALLTNFHLPKSTLLMLISALAGRDLILEAYAEAIAERYRFYSYGDCMLIV
jgi:S-adenosylmethionine:tRNA ribosyltransferase-isomerase